MIAEPTLSTCPLCHSQSTGFELPCSCRQDNPTLFWASVACAQELEGRLGRFARTLPPRYRNYLTTPLPDAVMLENKDALEASLDLKAGGVLYLYGEPGRGKTHSLVKVAKALLGAYGQEAGFLAEEHYFGLLESEMSNLTPRGEAHALTLAPILLYDDLGKRQATPYSASTIHALFERRISHGHTTLISSQLSPQAVSIRLCGDTPNARALESRLMAGRVFEFGGFDARKNSL